ncbi:MAG TPA: hypothetical protein VFQ61_06105 [Polyangiaceae bacterium]|nr:hypothetical protein [Polyangiaceae bacterium]
MVTETLVDQRTFLWDFFGPAAPLTAAHFKKHLDEFLARNALEGCETGTRSEAPGHMAAFCRTPSVHWSAVQHSLRPKRAL